MVGPGFDSAGVTYAALVRELLELQCDVQFNVR